jgi:hypothetical protein
MGGNLDVGGDQIYLLFFFLYGPYTGFSFILNQC